MPSASSRDHSPRSARPTYGVVTRPVVCAANGAITLFRYCGLTRMSLSFTTMCSKRARGTICARLDAFPFVPSISGHSTSRMSTFGYSTRSRATSATAGSSSELTPNSSSTSPAYCCRQWLTSPVYMRASTPRTGFRMVTGGAKPVAGTSFVARSNDLAAHSAINPYAMPHAVSSAAAPCIPSVRVSI